MDPYIQGSGEGSILVTPGLLAALKKAPKQVRREGSDDVGLQWTASGAKPCRTLHRVALGDSDAATVAIVEADKATALVDYMEDLMLRKSLFYEDYSRCQRRKAKDLGLIRMVGTRADGTYYLLGEHRSRANSSLVLGWFWWATPKVYRA